jgi:hypothetical protein
VDHQPWTEQAEWSEHHQRQFGIVEDVRLAGVPDALIEAKEVRLDERGRRGDVHRRFFSRRHEAPHLLKTRLHSRDPIDGHRQIHVLRHNERRDGAGLKSP